MITELQELINHETGEVSRPCADGEARKSDATRNVGLRVSQDGAMTRRAEAQELDTEAFDWSQWVEGQEDELEALAPRLVIRGAQNLPTTPPPPQKTVIDYLAITACESPAYFFELVKILIPGVSVFHLKGGWQGYKFRAKIDLYGQTIGLIAYGSQHGRNYLQLGGNACRHLTNWHHIQHYLASMEACKLSRVDIAADYYFGEISLDTVKTKYEAGGFKLPKARHNPVFDLRQPIGGNGQPLGWTAYIGKRENGKFVRIYHKGIEQFGKLSEPQQKQFSSIWGQMKVDEKYNAPEGATFKDWVRCEVEYKAKDRDLSLSMLTDRDNYFSGAYPYLEEILPMAEPKRPKTLPNNLETELEVLFANLQPIVGSLIATARMMGMSDSEICDKLTNGKINQRIVKAGGLDKIGYYTPKPRV